MNSEDKMSKELTRQERLDVEIKKSLDARTKEFKEKINKLTYEKIKQALVPSKEPLKGYPHNESMLDEADSWQDEIDYLKNLDKTDPKKAAAFRKRTKALKKGGGWNLQQKQTPAQKKIMQQMDRDAKKKHPNLYKEEVTISMDESVNEALKAGKGKGLADIDYVGDRKLTQKIEKMFKIKIKQTGNTTADVTGEKKDILNFLMKHYYYDNSDVMELHPEIVEDKDLEEFGGRSMSAADKANLRRRIADKRKK